MSNTELQLMEVIWETKEPLKQSQIMRIFEEKGRIWKRQTVNTFISRLEEDGLVYRENRRIYPIYTKEEYKAHVVRNAIDENFNGSLAKYIRSLLEKGLLSDDEIKEIKHIIN